MVVRTALIVLSSILTLSAGVPYLADLLKGKTKPRVVSWVIWSVLTGIATAASFSDHQYASAVLTLSESIETMLVAILGLMISADLAVEKVDVVCLAGALVGLLLWGVFNSPGIAVVASLCIDLIGSVPTIKHMWQKPFEETWATFLLSAFSGLLTLLAATDPRITEIASPAAILVGNVLFVLIIVSRRKRVMSLKIIHS